MVMSSSTVRACSATIGVDRVVVEDLGRVAHHMAGGDGQACAPIAARVLMSPARPPAPLGSLALKLITQAGGVAPAGHRRRHRPGRRVGGSGVMVMNGPMQGRKAACDRWPGRRRAMLAQS
jgi:hypothetical protein